jgi:hypothetical protein
MSDEQNDIDLRRMLNKRGKALALLDEFKEWYNVNDSVDNLLILTGLHRDIIRGTEAEVDRLIERMTEKNQQALMKKLETDA